MVAPCVARLPSRAGGEGDEAPAALACASPELGLPATSAFSTSAEGALVAPVSANAPSKAAAAAPAAFLERDVTESAGFGP